MTANINPLLSTTEKMKVQNYLPKGLHMVEVSTNCPIHGLVVREVVSIIADTAQNTCPKCYADELSQKEQIRLDTERQRTAYRSGISHYHDFGVWQTHGEQAPRMQGILNFAQSYLPSKNLSNLVLSGATGTGKTLLANLIASDFIRHGKCVKLIRASDIHSQVRATWSKSATTSEHELLSIWIAQDLLIIDEFGEADSSANTDTEGANRERISRIIDGRYAKGLPTIITTNLTKEQLIERLGDRAWDRLHQNAVFIAFNWQSYRQAHAKFVEI